MIEQLPPGMILFLGALLIPLLRGRVLQAYTLLLPVLGFLQVWALPPGHTSTLAFFSYELELIRVDRLSKLFGYIFHIAAFLGFFYALHLARGKKGLQQEESGARVQHLAAMTYAGSAIAGVFAGDLICLFIFWELTAITSVVLIWARQTERSLRAGMRYLYIQIGSGVLLLAGATLHYAQTGSIAFDHLGLGSAGTTLIFLAFGIKAAFPFLHNWLQDTYPESTVTGIIFLSSFTTKLAIYALARGFAGTEILIPIGAAMAAFPIFFAVIENDLRRVLAYSLNNQLGFMVVGIGIGTELSVNGACAHACADILFKSLLFMAMGAVLLRTGTVNGSELGGLYKYMPVTTVFCIVGASSISAFPLFSGFATKSLIMSATAEGGYTAAFLVLLFASAGVFHHAGIKIPFFAFFAHDSGIGKKMGVKEAPLNMLIAMGATAFLCLAIGMRPRVLYDLLPYPVDYEPYNTTHVVTQLQLLFYSALAFSILKKTGIYPPELRSVNIDTDWIYRKAAPWLVARVALRGGKTLGLLKETFLYIYRDVLTAAARYNRPHGLMGEPWLTGRSALWAALLLAAYVILHFL